MIKKIKYIKFFLKFKKLLKNKFLKKNSTKKVNKILLEFNSIKDCYIPYAFLSNKLSEKYNANIIAFNDLRKKNTINLIKYYIVILNPLSAYNLYRSFGTKSLISLISTKFICNHKRIIEKKFNNIFNNIKTKKQFEKLKINDVLIGDLLYDTYLKKFRKPTINLNCEEFKEFIFDELIKFYYWYNYIDKNVKGIIVSHTVYNLAIPMRICARKNIEAFQITWKQIHRLNKKRYMAYQEFMEFPKMFKKLNSMEKKSGLAIAKKRLRMRFNGVIGVDMPYSKKTAYTKIIKSKRLIDKSNKIKILIPTHCFYDSPHSYGFNIFPDFYEWLDFLGKMTEKTNYDWYIKTHPDYLPGTMEIVLSFIKKYPKIKLLPPESSHNQLIKEGIDVVLTTYGTIGCEYPLFNKFVVNASVNNPHIGYDFNFHCKSVAEYTKVLINLKKIIKIFKIDKQKIYEYYYMQHIYKFKNNFYSNLMNFKNIEQPYNYLTKLFQFIEKEDSIRNDINNQLNDFIYSKKYFTNL